MANRVFSNDEGVWREAGRPATLLLPWREISEVAVYQAKGTQCLDFYTVHGSVFTIRSSDEGFVECVHIMGLRLANNLSWMDAFAGAGEEPKAIWKRD